MKRIALAFLLLGTSVAVAQTWTQLPKASGSFGYTSPGARPYYSGYNRAVYDPFLHATFSRDRINACGDPYTNSDWLWFTATNSWQNVGWSGGGALTGPGGTCVAPPLEPDPIVDGISEPGDRHPFHQVAFLNAAIWMYGGVEAGRTCDDSASGICSFSDLWRFDDATLTWSQKASLSFSTSEGALEGSPSLNQLFLFGGLVSGNAVNRMSRYDATTDAWTVLTPAGQQPPVSDGAGMVWDGDDSVFVIWGGHACVTCTPTSVNAQIYLYDPVLNAYSKPQMLGDLPPGDVFPKMDYDTKQHLVVLYIAGYGVYTYSVPASTWTKLAIPGGPVLVSTLKNSLTMTYDSDTDRHLVHSLDCQCYWTLQLGDSSPPPPPPPPACTLTVVQNSQSQATLTPSANCALISVTNADGSWTVTSQ